MPVRRTVLKAGFATLTAGLLGGCGTGTYQGPVREVTIAGGQVGGFYLEFATLLADELRSAEPNLRGTAVPTAGSAENVRLIRDGAADLCLSQSDIALAALHGDDPFGSPVAARAIGRVYEDYLQLVVRADSPVHAFADLTGKSLALGANGSGAAVVAKRLLDVTGLRVTPSTGSLEATTNALRDRQLDAFFWSGGVPTPALLALHNKIGIRIVPLASLLPALRARYGTAYQEIHLPSSGYGQAGVPTIGVANLLLCNENLPGDLAAAVARTLVTRASRLVPFQEVGVQLLDPRALIGTLGVPLHPGAATTYRELHE